MAIFHDTTVIHGDAMMPSLGMLIGSRVGSEVYEAINSNGYKSFFGSDFDHMSAEFVRQFVRPMDQLSRDISLTVNAVMNPDRIRLLTSIDDYKSIPMSMELPILLMPMVRQALVEGRIDGFGYDPATLPEEDAYGRLIDNFRQEDVETVADGGGYFPISAVFRSDDPDLSPDDLYAIRKSREFIRDVIFAQTSRDPTDIETMRG